MTTYLDVLLKHMQGKHPQKAHAGGRGGGDKGALELTGAIQVTPDIQLAATHPSRPKERHLKLRSKLGKSEVAVDFREATPLAKGLSKMKRTPTLDKWKPANSSLEVQRLDKGKASERLRIIDRSMSSAMERAGVGAPPKGVDVGLSKVGPVSKALMSAAHLQRTGKLGT